MCRFALCLSTVFAIAISSQTPVMADDGAIPHITILKTKPVDPGAFLSPELFTPHAEVVTPAIAPRIVILKTKPADPSTQLSAALFAPSAMAEVAMLVSPPSICACRSTVAAQP